MPMSKVTLQRIQQMKEPTGPELNAHGRPKRKPGIKRTVEEQSLIPSRKPRAPTRAPPHTSLLPRDNPKLPEDDFELQAALAELAGKSIINPDEVVKIEKSGFRSQDLYLSRAEVFKWASNMASDSLVAKMHGVNTLTLQKHFGKELEMARAHARYRLQNRIFEVAVSGQNIALLMFCAKNYLNMTDVGLTEPLEGDGNTAPEELVKLTPAQVTALLKNATLTNTISIVKNVEEREIKDISDDNGTE
jgi:hypothetical protein